MKSALQELKKTQETFEGMMAWNTWLKCVKRQPNKRGLFERFNTILIDMIFLELKKTTKSMSSLRGQMSYSSKSLITAASRFSRMTEDRLLLMDVNNWGYIHVSDDHSHGGPASWISRYNHLCAGYWCVCSRNDSNNTIHIQKCTVDGDKLTIDKKHDTGCIRIRQSQLGSKDESTLYIGKGRFKIAYWTLKKAVPPFNHKEDIDAVEEFTKEVNKRCDR
jgi:hypothetical protein